MKQHNISPTLRVVVEQDEDATSPADFGMLGTVTYSSRARHTLGGRAVNLEEHERIGREIQKGNLIGMPVFAYIHSGVAIQAAEANPFPLPMGLRPVWLGLHRARESVPVVRLEACEQAAPGEGAGRAQG